MKIFLIVLAVLFGTWVIRLAAQPRRFRYLVHIAKQLPYIPFRYLS